jgi:hypothetical protein
LCAASDVRPQPGSCRVLIQGVAGRVPRLRFTLWGGAGLRGRCQIGVKPHRGHCAPAQGPLGRPDT